MSMSKLSNDVFSVVALLIFQKKKFNPEFIKIGLTVQLGQNLPS